MRDPQPLKIVQFSVKEGVVSNLMTSIQGVIDNKVIGYHVHLSSCMVWKYVAYLIL